MMRLLCWLGFHRWQCTKIPHTYVCTRKNCGLVTAGHP